MTRFKWQLLLALALIAASIVIYAAQLLVFRNPHETYFLFFQDMAFLPIHVLVVTVIIDQLLHVREKRAMINKMNMAIGVFFSEVGTHLLKSITSFDQNIEKIRNDLLITHEWTDERFVSTIKNINEYSYLINYAKNEMVEIKTFLGIKRDFLLRVLENPNLLEHEIFTELLWAVFHLTEELAVRPDLMHLTELDENHLAGDARRAYIALITQWLAYMRHLKKDYPYLFSLALRMNPFDPNASVTVK
jgi:hypothetical protein